MERELREAPTPVCNLGEINKMYQRLNVTNLRDITQVPSPLNAFVTTQLF